MTFPYKLVDVTHPLTVNDTLGPDTAESGYPVHQIILGHGKYLVENIANADLLPPTGSYILAAPISIWGGTEAPLRLIGLIE